MFRRTGANLRRDTLLAHHNFHSLVRARRERDLASCVQV